ncbi:helix-turn-helix domain-containing protein [Mannheimia sp. AT1]|uniref:Helix-turn-helix domain-containing protein n=1 Tax=Mannheimia cairinae TaxID=3025936 RepID=A0ABT5MLM8_9PAST|nr:helix-turn-helix domain-containing protein [Mannheimia cairinae]MDD0822902.1 helix-turn-helix domain-containing protein [Mannheimia cairinae]MDD0826070.1 helix-turn-helix domain-containing protein [Mannheimia cairinae]
MNLPKVAIVLYPDFNPIVFVIPQMLFAMEIEGKPLFEVKTVSENLTQAVGNGGKIAISADEDLTWADQADLIVVAGWGNIEVPPSVALTEVLQRGNVRGATIVGLCYGSYALAYAGILDGKQATTHWLAKQDFNQRFPQIQLDPNALYVEQDNVITSAGAIAGMDCCLAIVRKIYGVKISNHFARLMVTAPHREGGQAQFIEQPIAQRTSNQTINTLLDYLQQNLAKSHNIDDLATKLAMSRSTFTRHFRKATGMAVGEWLIENRLQRGRELLESSDLSIEQIASEIGFQTAVSFRQHFKAKHFVSPKQWRCSFGQ